MILEHTKATAARYGNTGIQEIEPVEAGTCRSKRERLPARRSDAASSGSTNPSLREALKLAVPDPRCSHLLTASPLPPLRHQRFRSLPTRWSHTLPVPALLRKVSPRPVSLPPRMTPLCPPGGMALPLRLPGDGNREGHSLKIEIAVEYAV